MHTYKKDNSESYFESKIMSQNDFHSTTNVILNYIWEENCPHNNVNRSFKTYYFYIIPKKAW